MFLRKYWLPLTVFVVALAGVSLYLLTIQAPKAPITIYTAADTQQTSPHPQEPVGETSESGHFHADGTLHADHADHADTHDPPVQPPSEASLPQTQTTTAPLSVIAPEPPIKAGDTAASSTPLLEDPVLAEFHTERLGLRRQQQELNVMYEDFIDRVNGGNTLSTSQVLTEVEDLRIRSETLLKQQVQWRRKYVEYTGTEHPGTLHWEAHDEESPQNQRERFKQDMESRGYTIMGQ